jgi:hypothetical protein
MKKFCFDINLDIPLLKPEINLYNITEYHNKFTVTEYINSELVKFFKQRDLVLLPYIEIFHSIPHYTGPIHIDVGHGDFTKLNYVYGGKDSTMNWYEPLITNNNSQYTLENREYIHYNDNQVKHVHSQVVGINKPSIVQVGVPHNSTNYDEDRYCVSLVFFRIAKGLPRLSMNESLEVFSDLL